jgi:fucose 4-O-acetylase-like acetyltransferase
VQQAREPSVDVAKGIGIMLVVLGHTLAVWGGRHEILHRFVYAFHMPLFLGISGLYVSGRGSFISFVQSKAVRFVIPFFFWVMFYFLVYRVLRTIKTLLQGFVNVNEVQPILDLPGVMNLCRVPIMGNWSSLEDAGIYVDLWFLPAVFSIVILYRILWRVGNQKPLIVLLGAVLFSFAIVHFNNRYRFHNRVPWSMDVAIVCLPFIPVCQYRSYVEKWHWLAIPGLILTLHLFSRNMTVEVAALRIENYPQFLVTAILGIMLVFLISSKIAFSRVGRMFSEIGKRSYLIFTLQGLVYLLFRPVMSRLPVLATHETLFNLLLFCAALICTYSIHPLFEKHGFLRFFALGQQAKQESVPSGGRAVSIR